MTEHRDSSLEEQDVSDVDSGKAFLGCDPLHQLGDLQGELDGKCSRFYGNGLGCQVGEFLNPNVISCADLRDFDDGSSETTAITA